MEKEKNHFQSTYQQEAVTLALATLDKFKELDSTKPAPIQK